MSSEFGVWGSEFRPAVDAPRICGYLWNLWLNPSASESAARMRSPFTLRRSPFTVHRSPFAVHRSPFTVRRSPFTLRRSPFTVHRSPFTVRRSPLEAQQAASPTRSHPLRSMRQTGGPWTV